MTRDHDSSRATRARMRTTGERYTVARSSLVAPEKSLESNLLPADAVGVVLRRK